MKDGLHKRTPGLETRWTPLSDHLFDLLRVPLSEFLTLPAESVSLSSL